VAATAAVLLSGLALVVAAVEGDTATGADVDECGHPPSGKTDVLGFRFGPGAEGVSPDTRATTIAAICRRLDALHIGHTLVVASGNRLLISAPAGPEIRRRVLEMVTTPGSLQIFDWEANLIGRERSIAAHPGFRPLPGALGKAEREWRVAGRDPQKPVNRRLIRSGAYPTFSGAASLVGARASATIVVSEQPLFGDGEINTDAAPGWYALHDAPALSGSEITNPAGGVDESGVPTLTFGFTAAGRRAFRRVTRRIARRGRRQVRHVRGSVPVDSLSGHLALVLDDEVKSRPIINFAEYPSGIDGRAGAQISGGFESRAEARDLATVLRFGALPLRLSLVR
jgi:hypothetical protein